MIAGLYPFFDHPDVPGYFSQVIDKGEVANYSDVLPLAFPGNVIRGIDVKTSLHVHFDK